MAAPEESMEIELRDYFQVITRRWPVIVVATLVVVVVAAVITFTQTSRYRAEAEVQIREPLVASSLVADPAAAMPNMASNLRQARASAVTDEVRAVVGDEPSLNVRGDEDEDLVTFSVISSDPDLAAEAANLHAEAFVEHRREALLDEYGSTLDLLQERRSEMEDDLAEMRDDLATAEAAVDPDSPNRNFELDRLRADHSRRAQPLEDDLRRTVSQIDEVAMLADFMRSDGAELSTTASAPGSPFEPARRRNLAVALVVGLLLGVGAAFGFEYLDRSVRTPRDLDRAVPGLPVLATVPVLDRDPADLAMRDHPRSPSAEAYRVLRASLAPVVGDETGHTLGVAGVLPGCGATTTAANLALVAARAGRRVVLIDCDLRQPSLHHRFGLDNEVGLTSVLRGDASLEAAAHRLTEDPSLVVITSGPVPADPAELLAGTRATSFLTSVAGQADLVLLDLPPVLAAADVFAVAPQLDGALVVVAAGETSDDDLVETVIELDRSGVNIVGAVLNRGRSARHDTYRAAPSPSARPAPEPRRAASDDWGSLPQRDPVATATITSTGDD